LERDRVNRMPQVDAVSGYALWAACVWYAMWLPATEYEFPAADRVDG
jgi:hypothetical protein